MDAQGSQANAKEDTLLLLLSSNLTTDLSQYGDNLTTSAVGASYGATGSYENNSVLRGWTGLRGRELYVKVPFRNGDADVVFLWHGDPANFNNHTFFLGLDVSGILVCSVNGTTAYSWALTSATDLQDYNICWSSRSNPNSTGAGNALISELMIWVDGEAYWEETIQFTHAVSTTNATWRLCVGGFGDNATWTKDSRGVKEARIGKAFHSHTEWNEDWVFQRTPPNARLQNFPMLPVPWDAELGFSPGENEWAGAANAAFAKRAAQTTAAAAKYSPLVNETYIDPNTWRKSKNDMTYPRMIGFRNQDSTAYWDLGKLRWAPIPVQPPQIVAASLDEPYVDYGEAGPLIAVDVRVFVKSWVTAGAAVPVRIYCWWATRPLAILTVKGAISPQPTLVIKEIYEDLTVNHGAGGTGQWLDLGKISISTQDFLDAEEGVWKLGGYYCLGWKVDPAAVSANDNNARIQIKAWQVLPSWPPRWEQK